MTHKNIEEVVKKLRSQGWKVTQGKKQHFIAFPPDKSKSPVTIAATPSDHRAFKNMVSRVRSRGAKI